MDRLSVIAAIVKVIDAGAVPASPVPGTNPESDESILRGTLSIGLNNPDTLDQLVSVLKAQPDIAQLEAMVVNPGPIAGAGGINLRSIAELLVCQSIVRGDPSGTVERFAKLLSDDSAEVEVAMSLIGVRIDRAMQIAPSVRLVPLHDLLPSMGRGAALGQGYGPFGGSVGRPKAALVTRTSVTPLLIHRDQFSRATRARLGDVSAKVITLLDECRNCLGLLGVYATFGTIWSRAVDPLAAFVSAAGWIVNDQLPWFVLEAPLKRDDAEPVCGKYFALPIEFRETALRIPLDRLCRAGRERDLADRAIDLGIALESLLLRNLDSQTELAVKLRLTGAWLDGDSIARRKETFSLLNKVYGLRSTAAHEGRLSDTEENRQLLDKGIAVCSRLIRRVIDIGKPLDWISLVLGDRPPLSDT